MAERVEECPAGADGGSSALSQTGLLEQQSLNSIINHPYLGWLIEAIYIYGDDWGSHKIGDVEPIKMVI